MNMKKKSLVAGLLAVSLAAQPVAATVAPRVAHAADAKEVKDAVAEAKVAWDKAVEETKRANIEYQEALGEYGKVNTEENQKKIKVAEEKLEEARTQLSKAELDLTLAAEEFKTAKKESDRITQELEALEALEALEETDENKEQIAKLTEDLRLAKETLKEKTQTLDKTNNKVEEMNLNIKSLESNLEAAKKTISDKKDIVDAKEKNLDDKRNKEAAALAAYQQAIADKEAAEEEDVKTVNGFNKAMEQVVKDYKDNKGKLSAPIKAEIARLTRVYPGLKPLEQKLISQHKDFKVYEEIVEEYKQQISGEAEVVKAVLDWRTELDKHNGKTINDLDNKKTVLDVSKEVAEELFNTYLSFTNEQKKIALKVISNGELMEDLNDSDAKKRFELLKEYKRVIIKQENDKMVKDKSLAELEARADQYKDKKNEVYELLVRDEYLNKSFTEVAETLKKVVAEKAKRFENKLADVDHKTATKQELQALVDEFNGFEEVLKNGKTYNFGEEVVIKGIEKGDLNRVKETLAKVSKEVKAYEDRANKLLAQANPSKHEAASILGDYYKLRPQVKNSVDTDIITKLIKIVDGVITEPETPGEKPEAYQTYYSRGVNIRNLDGKYLGYLTAGTSINGFVNKDGLIQFKHGDVEATVYPKFVTTDENNTYYAIDGTNVRSKAGLGGDVISYIQKGQAFQGRVVPNTNFLRVEVNGVTGYVAIKRASVEQVKLDYVSNGVKVRDAQNKEIGYLNAGAKFKGIRQGNKIEITYKGQVGYVHVAFVK